LQALLRLLNCSTLKRQPKKAQAFTLDFLLSSSSFFTELKGDTAAMIHYVENDTPGRPTEGEQHSIPTVGENPEDLAEPQSPEIAVDPQAAGGESSVVKPGEEYATSPSLGERRSLVWQILVAKKEAHPASGASTTDKKQDQLFPSSQKSKPSLADIMAEQNEDKIAARTGSGKDIPLFELEQEQERIMRLIQGSESKKEDRDKISFDSTPEEENDLLMLAMEQSLAEYSQSQKSNEYAFGDSDGTFGGADDCDLPEKTRNEIDSSPEQDLTETDSNDEVADALSPFVPTRISRSSSYSASRKISANNETRNASGLRRHMSMRELTRRDTGLKRSDLMNPSESVSDIKTEPSMRPCLADREFSRRTLEACERTVLDNSDQPYVDAQERRKRLQKTGFRINSKTPASRSARIPLQVATPNVEDHLPVDSRAKLMEGAKQHLSQREITEIEQALRDADEAYEASSPQPTAKPSCISRSIPQSPLAAHSVDSPLSPSASSPGSRSANSLPSLPPDGPNALCGVPETSASLNDSSQSFLSRDEATAIEAALREADAREEEESLMLAFQMQQEEMSNVNVRQASRVHNQGNVRTMTRAELERENRGPHGNRPLIGAVSLSAPPPRHPLEAEEHGLTTSQHRVQVQQCQQLSLSQHRELSDSRHRARQQRLSAVSDEDEDLAGFRMNMASAPQQWNRRDRNTIVGPNNEVRTKHDPRIEGQSNAQRLALEADEFGVRAHVGNKAFNSFRQNMKQRRTHKGVESHGTGRAGSDAESTKGGAMDPQVRLVISRAINSGLLDKCNGVVKQGKEAMLYHAESGANGGRFDVAVKVFKRIQEFRGRGEYVDGDPRYFGRTFRNAGNREQLEIWAEKEFRNLVRADRALVPVPTPLQYKDNVVFMRYMGEDGWPAPQLREIDLRRGSKRWDALYTQVMEAIRR
jgi:serine/threonine-protein kinase RIO1